MTDWRPIATAPKDGTEVLLAAPGRVTYGAWSAPSETPRIVYRDGFAPEPEWEEFEPYWASYDGGFTAENPPTHWMPMPDGPHDAAGSGAMTADDVRALLHERIAGRTHDALAAELGVTQGYLSKVLAGDCNPGEKLLRQLGLRKAVRYEPANVGGDAGP